MLTIQRPVQWHHRPDRLDLRYTPAATGWVEVNYLVTDTQGVTTTGLVLFIVDRGPRVCNNSPT
ncbi:MAG: hypothetical protein HC884_13760 [Chloroflexaceae bacterium]|nr:hypothetical protein [Chloroflexaceae bacterium]